MAKQKQGLPSGTAGLVRYFDDFHETVHIKPEWVVGATIFIVVTSFLLRPYITTLF
ncbi:MAG: preprotein translocase subunit Sec61beta [archaeon]